MRIHESPQSSPYGWHSDIQMPSRIQPCRNAPGSFPLSEGLNLHTHAGNPFRSTVKALFSRSHGDPRHKPGQAFPHSGTLIRTILPATTLNGLLCFSGEVIALNKLTRGPWREMRRQQQQDGSGETWWTVRGGDFRAETGSNGRGTRRRINSTRPESS